MAKIRPKPKPIEPLDWQQSHSPTERVTVKTGVAGKITQSTTHRRVMDARLWESMSGAQQEAAEGIRKGYLMVVGGLGVKVQTYERKDRDHRDYFTRAQERILTAFINWQMEMRRHRMKITVATDIVVEGRSCREVDRLRKQRKGTARTQLIAALDLF